MPNIPEIKAQWTGHDHWKCEACTALVTALEEAQAQVAAFRVLRELVLRRPYTADELRERFDAILGESK